MKQPETVSLSDLDIYDIGSSIQMVGVIYKGKGKNYLLTFPGEEMAENTALLPMSAEDWQKFNRQTDLLEVQVLSNASDPALAKIIVRKSQRQIDQHVAWRVYRRDGYRCRYCGQERPLTLDHLVTWEDGGPSSEDNCVAACSPCNRARGSTPYRQWLAHPYYKKVCSSLTQQQRDRNEAVADTLDYIPRMVHKRTR